MLTLVMMTCASDICLTRNQFRRIGELDGWQYFNRLYLYLDNDLSRNAAFAMLLPMIPLPSENIHVVRSQEFNAWQTHRALTALSVYQAACDFNQDFVRLDPDVYIVSSKFFDLLTKVHSGIAGKRMPFFLPSQIDGQPLEFVQGGASYWGVEARRFLTNLNNEEVEHFRAHCLDIVECLDRKHLDEYRFFFENSEDVVISGVLAISAKVERHHISHLQVSPYDILSGYKSLRWTYEDYVKAYTSSGAYAYHFEGGHDGRSLFMGKMLQRLYLDNHGDE